VTAVLEDIELLVGIAVGVVGTAVGLVGTAVGLVGIAAAVLAGTAAGVLPAGTVAAGSVKDSLTKKTAACPVKISDEIQRNLLKRP